MNQMIPRTEVGIPYPYEITFVDSETSPAIRQQIEENLTRLAHFYNRITFAHVYVRIQHKRRLSARQFHIHVQLDVPGRRLAASREPDANDRHLDIQRAVRDAFHKVTRQLEDFVKYRNGRKTHSSPPQLAAI